MAKLLKFFGQIKNEQKCLHEFRRRVSSLADLDDGALRDAIEKSAYKVDKTRYFTSSYLELEEFESDKWVMWVDSGFEGADGTPIYIQFTGGMPWYGALVGTESEILEYQREVGRLGTKDLLSKELDVDLSSIEGVTVNLASDSVSTKNETPTSDMFLKILYERLLIQSSWSLSSLDSYVYACITRINNMMSKDKDTKKFLVFNNDNTLALFNSGLLDKFGKYISILAKVDSQGMLSGSGLKSGCSKVNLHQLGFSKVDLALELDRVTFVEDSLSELVFPNVSLEDFDLENRYRLEHCINERKARFPESYENASSDVIYADIIKNIELALLLNKCDHSYIKPFYCLKRDEIEFIIPYHAGSNFSEKPELGIVVHYHEGYWQIMTVLDYDSVMVNIRLFEIYRSASF